MIQGGVVLYVFSSMFSYVSPASPVPTIVRFNIVRAKSGYEPGRLGIYTWCL